MLEEEGMERVFDRHRRFAAATRRAVQAWGLDFNCRPPEHRSASLTAVRMPDGWSADALRALILERFDVSLGNGLGKLDDRVFRIGHLGDLNDVTLLGTLAAVEMGARTRRRAPPAGRGSTRRWTISPPLRLPWRNRLSGGLPQPPPSPPFRRSSRRRE